LYITDFIDFTMKPHPFTHPHRHNKCLSHRKSAFCKVQTARGPVTFSSLSSRTCLTDILLQGKESIYFSQMFEGAIWCI